MRRSYACNVPSLETFVYIAVAFVLAVWTTASAGQCTYDVIYVRWDADCGIFGEPSISARGINDHDAVVGWTNCAFQPEQAFVWSREDGFLLIPMPPGVTRSRAYGVNDHGVVVGEFDSNDDDAPRKGFVWDGRTLTVLEPPPPANKIVPAAINDDGVIVGMYQNFITGEPVQTAFRIVGGVLEPIEVLAGAQVTIANDVNESGEITGYVTPGDGPPLGRQAYVWSPRSGTTILGVVPGGTSGEGLSISDLGHVAGVGWVEFGADHGLLFDGTSMVRIDPDDPPDDELRLNAVHHGGIAVGTHDPHDTASSAIIVTDGRSFELLSEHTSITTAELRGAYGINAQGSILVNGRDDRGVDAAVLLIPRDPPQADLTADCRVDLNDLDLLIERWGMSGPSPLDLDTDGTIGVADLLIVLRDWTG